MIEFHWVAVIDIPATAQAADLRSCGNDMSQRWATSSLPAAAMIPLLGLSAISCEVSPPFPVPIPGIEGPICRRVLISHSRTTPSLVAMARAFPSELNATVLTVLSLSFPVGKIDGPTCCWVATSQIRAVPSSPPVESRAPSGLNATVFATLLEDPGFPAAAKASDAKRDATRTSHCVNAFDEV
jgi:hypothetical protein